MFFAGEGGFGGVVEAFVSGGVVVGGGRKVVRALGFHCGGVGVGGGGDGEVRD